MTARDTRFTQQESLVIISKRQVRFMNELPNRKQIRIKDYDYSEPGAYFITICTVNREKILWNGVGADIIRPQSVPLSAIGKIAEQGILQIAKHYKNISVDKYCIMPDHMHLILRIESDTCGRMISAPTETGRDRAGQGSDESQCTIHELSPGTAGRMISAPTVSTVVGSMKRWVSGQVGRSVWQRSFYDHGIRNQQDYNEIRTYIENNPLKYLLRKSEEENL